MGKMYLNGHLYGSGGGTEYVETVLWSNESGQEFWPQSTYTATLSDNMFNYNLLAFTFSTVNEQNFYFTTLVPVSEIDKNGIKSFNSVVIGGNVNGAPSCYYVDCTHLAIAGWTSQFHMKIYKIIGIRCGATRKYSTTEQAVGTWIDGKTLYEKTFALTIPNTSGNYLFPNTAIPNWNFTVNVDWTVNGIGPRAATPWLSQYSIYLDEFGANGLYFYFQSSSCAGSTLYVTIQYTKTTD